MDINPTESMVVRILLNLPVIRLLVWDGKSKSCFKRTKVLDIVTLVAFFWLKNHVDLSCYQDGQPVWITFQKNLVGTL